MIPGIYEEFSSLDLSAPKQKKQKNKVTIPFGNNSSGATLFVKFQNVYIRRQLIDDLG